MSSPALRLAGRRSLAALATTTPRPTMCRRPQQVRPAPMIMPSPPSFGAPSGAAAAARRCLSSPGAALGYDDFSDRNDTTDAAIIPTRHSRHLPPPSCPPALLPATTSRLLSAPPGSLYAYDGVADAHLTKREEYEMGLVRSDALRQEFEWALRGHAASIEGSVISGELMSAGDAASVGTPAGGAAESEMSVFERVQLMMQLLERIEEEGKVYVELRARVRSSQLAEAESAAADLSSDSSSDSSGDSSSDSSSDEDDGSAVEEEEGKWRSARLIQTYGASPGPSVAMYDAVLDCLTVAASLEGSGANNDRNNTEPGSSALQALSVLKRALLRHAQDGGLAANNVHTVPTAQTYNATIRAAALTPYDASDETYVASARGNQLRDAMLDVAFSAFDAMGRNAASHFDAKSNRYTSNDVAKLNSSTFANMIRCIGKYIPPSKSRGNIAHGLFRQSTSQENVWDITILEALEVANTPSNGKEFDEWLDQLVQEEREGKLPQRWRREGRRRRIRRDDPTY